jgi:phosphoglucomutase
MMTLKSEIVFSAICRSERRGVLSDMELPATDAFKLILENDAWICIRPSGTEPKIKIAVCASSRKAAEDQLKLIKTGFQPVQ